MKWTNKGHQFDATGEFFSNIDDIYIYGAGEYGRELLKKLRVGKVKAYIDTNAKQMGDLYNGIPLISLEEFRGLNLEENHIVIIAASVQNTPIIRKLLVRMGYLYGVNCFTYLDFINDYYRIFALYRYNFLELNDLTFSVTNICTLKCKHCSLQMPYQLQEHRLLEDLKNDLDCVFENVDFIKNVAIIGGEPLAYPYLKEYISYMVEHYGERIGTLRIVTNGTLNLSNELLKVIKKCNVTIEISRYLINSKLFKADEIKKVCAEMEINCIEYSYERWIDFGISPDNKKTISEEELITFYDNCNSLCRGFINKSMVMCLPGYFANITNTKLVDKENTLNFKTNLEEIKKVIYEFDQGFTDSGFLDVCKYCNGFNNKRQDTNIPVAEQLTN